MNTDPDYSAAYVVLETDHADGLEGHGLTFTIGRGTEVCVAAVDALAPSSSGERRWSRSRDMGGFWRRLVADSQLRWIGPRRVRSTSPPPRSSMRSGTCGRSSRASRSGSCSSIMTPEQIVACVDFRYIDRCADARRGARDPARRRATRSREAEMLRDGFPAYTTSAGWLGYPTTAGRARSPGGARGGLDAPQDEGRQRPRLRRPSRRPDARESARAAILMLDANQVWDVDEAIVAMQPLARTTPGGSRSRRAPTTFSVTRDSARVAAVGVATGEHVQNRVMFKQLLQADAIDFCQFDACRVGGRQRGGRGAAPGGEVRHPGLPACRRGWAVRVRSASR